MMKPAGILRFNWITAEKVGSFHLLQLWCAVKLIYGTLFNFYRIKKSADTEEYLILYLHHRSFQVCFAEKFFKQVEKDNRWLYSILRKEH